MAIDESVRWYEKRNIRFIQLSDVLPMTQMATKFDFNISVGQIVETTKKDTKVEAAILHPNSDGSSHSKVNDNETFIQQMYSECNIGRINRR